MKKDLFANLVGGQILLQKGGLIRQWPFILYIFGLLFLIITIHFGVIDTAQEIKKNAETIKALKTEYTWKSSQLLYISRQSEVERMLKEHQSTLIRPVMPPTRIALIK